MKLLPAARMLTCTREGRVCEGDNRDPNPIPSHAPGAQVQPPSVEALGAWRGPMVARAVKVCVCVCVFVCGCGCGCGCVCVCVRVCVSQHFTVVRGVLHKVLGLLHRVLGVLNRILGVLHRVHFAQGLFRTNLQKCASEVLRMPTLEALLWDLDLGALPHEA